MTLWTDFNYRRRRIPDVEDQSCALIRREIDDNDDDTILMMVTMRAMVMVVSQ